MENDHLWPPRKWKIKQKNVKVARRQLAPYPRLLGMNKIFWHCSKDPDFWHLDIFIDKLSSFHIFICILSYLDKVGEILRDLRLRKLHFLQKNKHVVLLMALSGWQGEKISKIFVLNELKSPKKHNVFFCFYPHFGGGSGTNVDKSLTLPKMLEFEFTLLVLTFSYL